MPEPRQQPWTPGPAGIPFSPTLFNPLGDQPLAFDEKTGRWLRLRQHRPPRPLHTGAALCAGLAAVA